LDSDQIADLIIIVYLSGFWWLYRRILFSPNSWRWTD